MRSSEIRIAPHLHSQHFNRIATTGRHSRDEVRHHVDDVVCSIRSPQVCCIIVDQPAAVPQPTGMREASARLMVDSTALAVPLMLASLACQLVQFLHRHQLAAQGAATALALHRILLSFACRSSWCTSQPADQPMADSTNAATSTVRARASHRFT